MHGAAQAQASTCNARGRTGTGRHRTRASGYAARHRQAPHQGKRLRSKAQGAGKPGRTGGIDPGRTGRIDSGGVASIRAGWHKAPSTQPLALALSSGTGPGMGRQAAPGQRQAAKPQGTGHRAPGTGKGKPGRTGGIDPGGSALSSGRRPPDSARARPAPARHRARARPAPARHRARARPAPARHRARARPAPARHRARASRAARAASIRAGWHPAPSTQPLALATRHRTHPKGKQTTPKGSAAPPIRGQRGHFSRPFPGPCVRVRWWGIEYRTRANSKGSGAPCRRVDSSTANTARKRQNHGRAVAHWNKTPKPGTSASDSGGQGKTSEGKGRRQAKKRAEYM